MSERCPFCGEEGIHDEDCPTQESALTADAKRVRELEAEVLALKAEVLALKAEVLALKAKWADHRCWQAERGGQG